MSEDQPNWYDPEAEAREEYNRRARERAWIMRAEWELSQAAPPADREAEARERHSRERAEIRKRLARMKWTPPGPPTPGPRVVGWYS
jgi:hypothetical protein